MTLRVEGDFIHCLLLVSLFTNSFVEANLINKNLKKRKITLDFFSELC